jgi:uncharacterized membrane protein YqaE (UPF0057 family)
MCCAVFIGLISPTVGISIAILLPPVPVFLKAGCGGQLLINILLCCLAWIPGIIHAWWVIGKHTTPARSARNPPHKDVYGGPLLIASNLLTTISLSTTVPLMGAHPPAAGQLFCPEL